MSSYMQAYVQDTHKYNPDYAYLDKGHYEPWYWRILSERFYPGEDYDEWGTLKIRIKVKGNTTRSQIWDAMNDHYQQGCSCEHDCCGHLHGGLYGVEKPSNRKKNEWILTVWYGRNY